MGEKVKGIRNTNGRSKIDWGRLRIVWEIFWRSGPCLRYHWQICFLILLISLYFNAVFFSPEEAFYFDEVPFVYYFLYVPCFRGLLCEDAAIPLLGLYPKNPETPIQKNLCTPMFIEAQFTIAKY